ncbi:MAG: hypothetical protein CO128_10790 [Ignavibacteriales bacterium CG_4_9_14_3_um_filter_30_11]|nr:MAG: hypothetical protein CO128_10790 [Ignavibacteriales bacterium CG_4_9_14_3_um_filter_30_11]
MKIILVLNPKNSLEINFLPNPWQFVRKTYYSNNEFQDFYITKYMIFIYLQIVCPDGRFSNGKSGLKNDIGWVR